MRSAETRAKKPAFNELILSIPFALTYSHFIGGFNEKGNYLELFLEKDYLIGFALRSSWAFISILLIKYATHFLNVKVPWPGRISYRLFAQVFYGVFSIVLLDFFIATLYFYSRGIDISDTIYFDSHLVPVSIYIMMVNLYYNYGYFLPHAEIKAEPNVALTNEESSAKKHAAEISGYVKENDIVYIGVSRKVNYAKNRQGESVIWNHTLAESIAALPRDLFFLAGRSCIVHRDAIEVTIKPETRCIMVILKSPLSGSVKIPDAGIVAFQNWWHQKEERKCTSGLLIVIYPANPALYYLDQFLNIWPAHIL